MIGTGHTVWSQDDDADGPSSALRVRMRPPPIPNHYLHRDRLTDLLDEVVQVPVALVVAPAGAGKTVLASAWSGTTSTRTAWLSLDVADRGGHPFWLAVIATLESQLPELGRDALGELRRRAPLADVVGELTVELDGCAPEPLVLVIDDVHVVDDDDDVATSLAWFLEHHPPWLHVVLLARREPNLPLDRLRGRGRIGQELRFAELRFSPDEAIELLRRCVPSLPEADLTAAAGRAEGWAAGLQLYALATRSAGAGPEPALHGPSDRKLVDDFIWHEVLAAEPADVLDAMRDLTVVARFNHDLARALSDHTDVDALLDHLVNRGLLITDDGDEPWVGLPSAVRSALLHDLDDREPERAAKQHARAAAWLQSTDDIALAIEHWLLADQPRQALRSLASKVAWLYDTGQEAVVTEAVADIPLTVAYDDLESMLEFGWCHVLVDSARFVELVDHATWWAERSEASAVTLGHLAILQSIAAAMTGDLDACGALARQGVAALGRGLVARSAGALRLEHGRSRRGPRGALGGGHRRRAASRVRPGPRSRASAQLRGHAGARPGARRLAPRCDPRQSQASATPRPPPTCAILRMELALAEAIAHREIGDQERVAPDLVRLAEHPVEPMGYVQLLAMFELVHASIDDGRLDQAQTWFDRLEQLVAAAFPAPAGRNWLGRAGTSLSLASGDLDAAHRWADGIADASWQALGRARIHLAEGRAEAAAVHLDAVEPRNVREDVVVHLLRARTIADRAEALKHVVMAVEMAAGAGLLQTVASEGAAIIELVERAAWRAPEPWLDRLRRLSTFGSVRAVDSARSRARAR